MIINLSGKTVIVTGSPGALAWPSLKVWITPVPQSL
ncbi:MAG: hypothetical protein ACJA2P_000489 [Rhodoferax sp.]|jgi:hypothetical protein